MVYERKNKIRRHASDANLIYNPGSNMRCTPRRIRIQLGIFGWMWNIRGAGGGVDAIGGQNGVNFFYGDENKFTPLTNEGNMWEQMSVINDTLRSRPITSQFKL